MEVVKIDKKIQAGCFRELEPGESRLLIMRHGTHKDNVLTEQAIRQAMATGAALATSRMKIDDCISSPSPRAIRTVLAVLEGYGKMQYVSTDPDLSDLAYDHADDTTALKAHMAEIGRDWSEPNIAKTIFDPNDKMAELGSNLANGAESAFLKAIKIGKSTLITTHGVGRIEPGLILLRRDDLHIPERLIEMGQIVEVILDEVNVVEENWLEPVTALAP